MRYMMYLEAGKMASSTAKITAVVAIPTGGCRHWLNSKAFMIL
jgi:hypothetical protein